MTTLYEYLYISRWDNILVYAGKQASSQSVSQHSCDTLVAYLVTASFPFYLFLLLFSVSFYVSVSLCVSSSKDSSKYGMFEIYLSISITSKSPNRWLDTNLMGLYSIY